mmetsp:Transcript_18392/g.24389  ORF Transcript_18392/g.24389 Transcript_18392/m.24389 type:complete len:89 (-) Transcript_18392:121-387(-)
MGSKVMSIVTLHTKKTHGEEVHLCTHGRRIRSSTKNHTAPVLIAKVDCAKCPHTPLCHKKRASMAYPTLRLFLGGKKVFGRIIQRSSN